MRVWSLEKMASEKKPHKDSCKTATVFVSWNILKKPRTLCIAGLYRTVKELQHIIATLRENWTCVQDMSSMF